jgi:hypothetical protein
MAMIEVITSAAICPLMFLRLRKSSSFMVGH